MIEKILTFFNLTLISTFEDIKSKLKTSSLSNKNLQVDIKKYKATIKNLEIKVDKLTPDKHHTKNSKSQDDTKLKAWSKRVRTKGKCDICESTERLSAHHLWDKKTHPTLKYQDENGVCLCLDCHNGFHKMYTSASQTSPSIFNKYKIIRQNQNIIYK